MADSTFRAEESDVVGVARLALQVERMDADTTAKIACFNHDEAVWIRERLECVYRIDPERFFMSWLVWPSDE